MSRPRPNRPAPPVQIRQFLLVARRQGVAFEDAWREAHRLCLFDHDKRDRIDSREALDSTKWAWRSSYEGGDPIPGAAGLLALRDLLAVDDDTRRAPARIPPRAEDLAIRKRTKTRAENAA
jgi:hypothetical protein